MLAVPFLALALGLADPQVRPLAGTFRYDPVELVRTGKAEVGALSIFEDRYAYRYLFLNEENHREFLAHPDRYEIQLGGGCGSMGSLSGRGSPDRFAVYEGRIYIFASDGCRKSFLAGPEKRLEKDDAPITGTPDQAKAGKTLADRMLAWAGGVGAWRSQRGLAYEFRERVRSGEVDYDHRKSLAVLWPGHVFRTDRWNESTFGDLIVGTRGFFINAKEVTPMDPQQIRELQRVRNHWLPAVLKAAASSQFAAFDRGPRPDGLHRLDTYFDRTWVGLDVVPTTGEIRAMEFTGRREAYGIERHAFTAFDMVGSLRLPMAWEVHFEGKPGRHVTAGQSSYSLRIADDSFTLPASAAKATG